MKFFTPHDEELSYLRPDPLLWEQELDVRPEVASAIERAAGIRAGRVYWRSQFDHLYALELADLGRGRPSMATVYGFWDRFEPRPPEHEIDADLLDLSLWVAEVAPGMEPVDVRKVADRAGITIGWPDGSVLRTPEDRFADLPGFPYPPRYLDIEGLRVAYVEHGAGDPILLLHGEPTWGYLYRRMIPRLAQLGKVVVPDLIGFGRSDKPVAENAYSYRSHARWVRKFVDALGLEKITLVCQDWGGLLGIRLVAERPQLFSRLVAMNTYLPDGSNASDAFRRWRFFSQRQKEMNLPAFIRRSAKRSLGDAEADAYGAPFPSREYQTAVLNFPRLVPIRPDEPGAYENRLAIARLQTLDLPVLLIFSGGDPITLPGAEQLHNIFRHAAEPVILPDAGHFIQEDAGEDVAERIADWMLVH